MNDHLALYSKKDFCEKSFISTVNNTGVEVPTVIFSDLNKAPTCYSALQEKFNDLKQDFAEIKATLNILLSKLDMQMYDNPASLREQIKDLSSQNSSLKKKIEELEKGRSSLLTVSNVLHSEKQNNTSTIEEEKHSFNSTDDPNFTEVRRRKQTTS